MIISTVVGIGVISGIIEPAAKDTLLNSINAIVGAAITVIPVISYIASRTWLKAKTATEVKNA